MEEEKIAQELLLVADSNAIFARKFYQLISSEEPGKNLIFSPLSAHTILSLVYQGASGKTAQDFEKALELTDKKSTAVGYNGVIDVLNAIDKITLHVANKIFVMKNFPLKTQFEKASSELFRSETQVLNFKDTKTSAKAINGWVEEKTNSKIKDLIDSSDLDELTRLVLVNAVYFKGNWAYPFNKDATQTKPFYISKCDTVDCQMMYIKRRFKYSQDERLDAKIVELPYENRDVSMVIILPNEIDGIGELEKKLQDVDLATISENLNSCEVNVYLPRFKIESKIDLQSILTKMGLEDIFDEDKANFSEISDSKEQLYVSKAVQKAFIEVNEEGAEAAAATAVVIKMRKCCRQPLEEFYFEANHPFIILLKLSNTKTSTVLFMGKLLM